MRTRSNQSQSIKIKNKGGREQLCVVLEVLTTHKTTQRGREKEKPHPSTATTTVTEEGSKPFVSPHLSPGVYFGISRLY